MRKYSLGDYCSIFGVFLLICFFIFDNIGVDNCWMSYLAFGAINFTVVGLLCLLYEADYYRNRLSVYMLGTSLLIVFVSYVTVLILSLPIWLKNAIELENILGLLLFICMGIVYPYFFVYYAVVRMPDEHPVWSFLRCLIWYEFLFIVEIFVVCVVGVFDDCFFSGNVFSINSVDDILRYICIALDKMSVSNLSAHTSEGVEVFCHYSIAFAGVALKNVPKYKKPITEGADGIC